MAEILHSSRRSVLDILAHNLTKRGGNFTKLKIYIKLECVIYRTSESHSGGYGECCLLGYNAL
jgi:hypothetical protein